MMRAKVRFKAFDGTGEVTIEEGEFVEPGHVIVQRHPDRFTAASSIGRIGRRTATRSAERRSDESIARELDARRQVVQGLNERDAERRLAAVDSPTLNRRRENDRFWQDAERLLGIRSHALDALDAYDRGTTDGILAIDGMQSRGEIDEVLAGWGGRL